MQDKKWYCTGLDEEGYFRLHVETKHAYASRKMRMTKTFWFDVRDLDLMLYRCSARAILITRTIA